MAAQSVLSKVPHSAIKDKMVVIKLAYYRKEDWNRFIDLAEDRESMHDTWIDWHKDFLKARKGLISEGFEVFEVVVDIDELINYCRLRGIKNDGKARSQFVSNK